MSHPRLLILAMGRINAADESNNGLLLRNLLAGWPRERLAQVFSDGSNGDNGFCGAYFQLGPPERRFGDWFYRMKASARAEQRVTEGTRVGSSTGAARSQTGMSWLRSVAVDTGLYELVFRPRVSRRLSTWISSIQPEIILAQGYNLAFTWLPLLIARSHGTPIAYYPTDDWPTDLYRDTGARVPLVGVIVRRAVATSSRALVRNAAVRIAFNQYMQAAYGSRYGATFSVLMHGDSGARFDRAEPRTPHDPGQVHVACAGAFDRHRMPLLEDLERACALLTARGLPARATVYPAGPMSQSAAVSRQFRHVTFAPCPTHAALPGALKGADVLFLPERFDETAEDIRLCVSSKAHLFMFAGRPVVVYSDRRTGISRYASEFGWAAVVQRRDPAELASTIERVVTDSAHRDSLVARARKVAMANHDLRSIQETFLAMARAAVASRGKEP